MRGASRPGVPTRRNELGDRAACVKRTLVIVVALLVAAIALIGWLASRGTLDTLDSGILLGVRPLLGTTAVMRRVMLDLTGLGDTATLIVVLGVVAVGLALTSRRTLGAFLFVEAGVGLSVAHLLKPLFARARPMIEPHLTEAAGLSFPSGHASNSTIVFLSIALLIVSSAPYSGFRRFAIAIASLLAAGIGISRIYLGVHWPSDVMAGWMLGIAWVIPAAAIAQRTGLIPGVDSEAQIAVTPFPARPG